MHIARSLIAATTLALSCVGQPATAQPAGPPTAPTAPPADAWTVSADAARGRVVIGKRATDGQTTFTAGCDKAMEPGFAGNISHYRGSGLQTVPGGIERVLIEVEGEDWKEAFSAQLRYVRDGSWDLDKVLAPVFVSAFSRGDRLTVVNEQWQKVMTFELTGSSAAARAMRTACGFQ